MKVSEMMTRDVHIASPDDTIGEAAKLMAQHEIGFLPVGEKDQLVGSLTDRDMVVRGLADGLDATAKVHEVMTKDVKYCFEDDDVDEVARNLGDNQLRRLAVVNRDKRLTGVFSIGDAALGNPSAAGAGLEQVAQPGGRHAQ